MKSVKNKSIIASNSVNLQIKMTNLHCATYRKTFNSELVFNCAPIRVNLLLKEGSLIVLNYRLNRLIYQALKCNIFFYVKIPFPCTKQQFAYVHKVSLLYDTVYHTSISDQAQTGRKI